MRLLGEKIRALAQAGKAILLTTHRMEVAETLADRVATIHRGEVVLEETKERLLARFAEGAWADEAGAGQGGGAGP